MKAQLLDVEAQAQVGPHMPRPACNACHTWHRRLGPSSCPHVHLYMQPLPLGCCLRC